MITEQAAVQTHEQNAVAQPPAHGEFLANITHEVRTPLNSIIAMTDLVLNMELGSRQRDYLRMVKGAAESLLTMLNNVLDFSKAEAGKILLNPVPFSVRQLFEEVLRPAAARALANNVELVYSVDSAVPEDLFADLLRLRQVLQNLVGNALKFTERGRIEVRAELDYEEGEFLMLKFMVSDTGIGIPKDRQQGIFEAFTQADGSTTRRYGGTGLGLSIASRLVELMQGRIWVDSEPGQGSRFYFTAQAQRLLPESLFPNNTVAAASGTTDARVLIVEDNLVNRSFVSATLRGMGYDVCAVNSGKEALAAIDSAQFDVALLDIQMPGMDGMETARQLRARQAHPLRIVAMTARPLESVMEQASSAGIDSCLAKPLSVTDLRWAVALKKPPRNPEEIPAKPTLGMEAALTRTGGDRLLLSELAGLFLQELPGLVENLGLAVAQGNARDVEAYAHGLKGSASNFGADQTVEYALQLEQKGRQRDLTGAADVLIALEQSIESITPELQALAQEALEQA